MLELPILISHPGMAIALGLLFTLVWTIDRKRYNLAFASAYVLYGAGILMQTLRLPADVPVNIVLSGLLYCGATVLLYAGLVGLENARPRWALVGALTAAFLLLRVYFAAAQPPQGLRAVAVHAYLASILLLACWQIRHLARASLLEALPFWVIVIFTLLNLPRAFLAMLRGPDAYGYDGSLYWITTQLGFNALIVLLAIALMLLSAHRKIERLRHQTQLDPLTRTYNRAGLLDLTRAEFAARRRYSLIVIDLDYFKRINDEHGHATGDRVLREVARAIDGSTRTVDMVARYGGEEFLVFLPDAGIGTAVAIAERIRQAIEGLKHNEPRLGSASCTASLGVAEFAAGIKLERAYEIADSLMYKAKLAGRNRVCHLPMPVADAGAPDESSALV